MLLYSRAQDHLKTDLNMHSGIRYLIFILIVIFIFLEIKIFIQTHIEIF